MKIFAATLVSTLATFAAAEVNPSEATLMTAGYPKCSFPCLRNMVERTGCASYDLACFCRPDKRDIQTKCVMTTNCSHLERSTIQSLDNRACAAIPGVPGHPHNPAVDSDKKAGHDQGHDHTHPHTHSPDKSHDASGTSDSKDIKVINTTTPKNTAPKNGEPAKNKTATSTTNTASPNEKTDSGLASITYMPSLTLIGLLGGAAAMLAL